MESEAYLRQPSSGVLKLLLQKGDLPFHEFLIQSMALALTEEPGECSELIILNSETGIVVRNALYRDGLFEWQE